MARRKSHAPPGANHTRGGVRIDDLTADQGHAALRQIINDAQLHAAAPHSCPSNNQPVYRGAHGVRYLCARCYADHHLDAPLSEGALFSQWDVEPHINPVQRWGGRVTASSADEVEVTAVAVELAGHTAAADGFFPEVRPCRAAS